MRRFLSPLLCLAALPAIAQTALGPEAFDAYTEGKTLTFSADGAPYGAEEYLSDRRVRWSFLDGQCKTGRWYPQGDAICFVYEDGDGPQCWRFYSEGSGLRAEFMGDSGSTLYETQASDEPLTCLGPEVGV